MPSQLLTLLLSSMLLTLSTAGLVPLERRAIGCGTCYEVGSKRITINGGNSCYVDCSLQQVDSASEVCCVSFFFLTHLVPVIPCVLCVGDGTKKNYLLIWGAMDFCLPGCRFCRLIRTTCTLGLFVEGRFGVGSGWRSGEGKGVGSCGANTKRGVVVVVVKMERIEFGAVTCLCF